MTAILGKRLASIRIKQGYSQARLADKAGLHKNIIAKIEQGATKKPTLETVEKISKALGVQASELLGY